MATLTVEYFKKNYASLKDIPDDVVASVLHRLKEDWITTTTDLENTSRDTLLQRSYPIVFVDAVKPAEGEEFKDASELKLWLEGKGVRERVASMTASTLFEQGFYKPSTLLGISSKHLVSSGLLIPSAYELSNALKQVSLNLCVWCFICCVRDLSVSPLFSLWVFPDIFEVART